MAAPLLAVAGSCGSPPETFSVDPGATGRFPDAASASAWRRWGGPNGDFKIDSDGRLASSWPPDGPPLIWSRPLGEGYSAVVSDRGTLFTLYRDGEDDVVVALRADDGASVWEYRYPARTYEGNQLQFGSGPNATPLVLDDRIVTLGYGGTLSCLELSTGRLLWSRDLMTEFEADVLDFGFSASPIPCGDAIIVLVGGDRQAVVAFDPSDGSVTWTSPPGSVSYATPMVIDVDGQDQIVYFSADEIIGLDAGSGERLWSHPCVNEYRNNATGPLWAAGNLLWVATQEDGGTRVLRLRRDGESTTVEEVWFDNTIRIHFWNAVEVDGYVYASIGRSSIVAGVDIRTGEVAWRRRGFEQANIVQVGEESIVLDANGELALATLSPDGMEVHSQVTLLDGATWTAPTLVGTTLYVRDKKSIRALDLGVGT